MCGICGIFDPQHKLAAGQIETDIPRMMAEINYRGPDDRGTFFDAPCGLGLGHLRLSIIDLSGGHQPMSTADGRLSIVFNGEIYNFESERQALEETGYRFRTRSDTEVILALYERYGVDAWPRLRGQFAFGLWDARQKCLFLVRDRLGEKPLIYSYHNGVLFFASELKAVLGAAAAPREMDDALIGLYFLMLHVPAPHTLIKGVKKLPSGCYLKADAQGMEITPYWKPRTDKMISLPEPEMIDRFRSLFQEAVKLCTVSDVPVGTFLSGGLDSTSVTWAAAQTTPQSLHSFAIFNQENHESHPDWKYAQEAAAFLKTTHHNVFYDLPGLMRLIPELIEKTDEPFHGPTALVSLHLSKSAREFVKVVLTGSGGDELLGGYQSYYQHVLRAQTLWQQLDQWVPQSARNGLGAVLGRLHPVLARIGMRPEERRMAANLRFHAGWFDILCPGQGPVAQAKLFETLSVYSTREQSNYFKRYLLDDLLINNTHALTTLPDATGMACSLEARNPFLDYKLVEFLINVDPELLIRKTYQNKYLLIKAMQSRIPDSILYRPKMGFSGMTQEQIVRWTRTEGRVQFRDGLLDSKLVKDGFLSKPGLEQVWRRFDQAPSADDAIYYMVPIWSAGLLAMWYRRLPGAS